MKTALSQSASVGTITIDSIDTNYIFFHLPMDYWIGGDQCYGFQPVESESGVKKYKKTLGSRYALALNEHFCDFLQISATYVLVIDAIFIACLKYWRVCLTRHIGPCLEPFSTL